ncbi:hypothetical protein QUA41_17800 [Microcoleus sp. Pol11C1]|uniref:hypothetical protein n=1 Tax=unclassified Microcoleus TaxID=2642155 RepID=UPI002FD680A7
MNQNQPGCYLIHWQPAIGNLSNSRGTASHYLGSTKKPVGDRLMEHQSKVGARITKAAVEQGRELVLVRTWRGGWSRERELKKRHNNRLLCPICNPHSGGKRRKPRKHKGCDVAVEKD